MHPRWLRLIVVRSDAGLQLVYSRTMESIAVFFFSRLVLSRR